MRYYIVDDNIATVKTLENIVKSRNLGSVCGYSTSPEDAIKEILEDKPEIVLVDFLMEGMDGVEMIEKIRGRNEDICFVMISKITDKEMVQNAYTAGIEFFINKPVNIVEVETVLNNVMEKIKMKGMLSQLKTIMNDDESETRRAKNQKIAQDGAKHKNVDHLLGNLGMLGERGCQDIKRVFAFMSEHNCEYGKNVLSHIESETGDSAKNIEQRMRRAIKKGLTNTANILLDDDYSDIIDVYAHYVFDFYTIREEMNCLKGKSSTGGKVNVSQFMNGLIVYGSED
ncbi:MAG: DNA-binding domain-containing protein [Clostridia bacterium]|nr:DNA-binding domain-containing protein [Clostridia bacterium]